MESEIYIGPNKVVSNESLDTKLPSGVDLFKLTYGNGTTEILTRLMFEALASDKPTDLTQLRDNRIYAITPKVLALFLDWGVNISEINYLLDTVTLSVNNAQSAADNKVWGKDRMKLSFLDLDQTLRVVQTTTDTVIATTVDTVATTSDIVATTTDVIAPKVTVDDVIKGSEDQNGGSVVE